MIRFPPRLPAAAPTVEQGHAVSHDVKDTLLQAGKRILDVVVHLEPHVDP